MSRLVFFRWGGVSVGLALVFVVLLQGLGVSAAPPEQGPLGITPTPTPGPTATPAPPGAGVDVVDPVITKRGEPSEAVPGEEVVFTLEVTNQGQYAAIDVVVTDQVDQYLEIVEVTTTQGTVSIDGQLITVDVGVVGPGFLVEIVIRTRVRLDAPVPLDLENTADLRSPNGGDRVSPPVVIPVSDTTRLPETGSTSVAGAIGVALFAVMAALAGAVVKRGQA